MGRSEAYEHLRKEPTMEGWKGIQRWENRKHLKNQKVLYYCEEREEAGSGLKKEKIIEAKKIIGEGRGLDFKDNSGRKTVLRL